MKRVIAVLVIIAAIATVAMLANAETSRLGSFTAPAFNATRIKVATTTYTITALDSQISATATGGAFTVTLPVMSTVTAGGTKTYKIVKTDSSTNAVTVAAGSGDTIGGEASRKLILQNHYMIVSTGPNRDWQVIWESPYFVENHLAGTVTMGTYTSQ